MFSNYHIITIILNCLLFDFYWEIRANGITIQLESSNLQHKLIVLFGQMLRGALGVKEERVHILDIILADLVASVHLAHLMSRGQQLDGVAQRGAGSNLAETCKCVLLQLQSLGLGAQLDYLLHVGSGVE